MSLGRVVTSCDVTPRKVVGNPSETAREIHALIDQTPLSTMPALHVKSLETLAFDAVPLDDMLKFLAEVWTSPLRLQYWNPFKQNLSLTEMSRLAKTHCLKPFD